MPRKKAEPEKKEPLRIVRTEIVKIEDGYKHTIDYLSDGGTIKNRYPLEPEEPKEVIMERVSEMFVNAWYNAQAQKKRAAEAANAL